MNADFLVDFPGLGIFDVPVSRVVFQIAEWPIYWYGLLIASAIILCMLLAMKHAPAYQLTADNIMDTFIAIIPLMIIFARLYYVVLEWDYYAADWRRIISTRDGGLAFYGGVIGGVIAILLVTRIRKIAIANLLDFLVVYVPLGQAIGRWGNFFNQEAFGTNTSLPWGMYSNGTEAYLRSVTGIPGLDPTMPVHPTFFYEFLANMLIFVWLLRVRKNRKYTFQVMLWYLLLYGLVRYFVEGIRTDPLMIGETSIRMSQVVSALMVLVSIPVMFILRQRRQRLDLAAALAGDDAEQAADAIADGPAGDGGAPGDAPAADEHAETDKGTEGGDSSRAEAAPATGDASAIAASRVSAPTAANPDYIQLEDDEPDQADGDRRG
jgi:phosphatidylglycerol:prolipoprotein diacylglycerol transferase